MTIENELQRESRRNAFALKVETKQAEITARSNKIREDLLKASEVKPIALERSSLLDDPTLKDFEWSYNPANGYADGDTVNAASPYNSFYGDKTITEPVRLAQRGSSLDTYETRKIVDGVVQPYPENKKKYHQIHYAQQNGLPSFEMVSDDMLFDEADNQTNELLKEIYKGVTWNDYGETIQDGTVNKDGRKNTTVVPYPKDVQNNLDALQIELNAAKTKESGETSEKENRTQAIAAGPGSLIPSMFANAFNFLRDNITEDFASKSVREIEEQIANVKIAAKANQKVDSAVLTGNVNVDIRTKGVGIYDRKLGTLFNTTSGKNINIALNTPANNAAYMSKYNQAFTEKLTNNLTKATVTEFGIDGLGFWKQADNAFDGGIDTMQALGFSFAAWVVDAFGGATTAVTGKKLVLPNVWKMFSKAELEFKTAEEFGTYFNEKYQDKLKDATKHGKKMPLLEDLDWSNGTQILSKLGDIAGEGVPSVAVIIGGGGIGGTLAVGGARLLATSAIKKAATEAAKKSALKKIKSIGTKTGVLSTAIGMQTGSIYGEVASGEDGDRSGRAILLSGLGGVASGSLEAIFPLSFFKKSGMSKKVTDGIKKKFSKRLVDLSGKIVKETATGSITEGTTEGLQFIIEEITQEYIKSGELLEMDSEEFISGFWNSFAAGVVIGGGMRTGTSTISGVTDVIKTDASVVKEDVQELRNEAGNLENEIVAGDADTKSQEVLANEVSVVEASVIELGLGIELDKKYNKKDNLNKAVVLSEALNDAEIAQRELPSSKRDKEIFKAIREARKSLNNALNEVKTGDATTTSTTRAQIIESDKNKQIDNINKRADRLIENAKNKANSKKYTKSDQRKKIKNLEFNRNEAIAKQETKADKALKPILAKAAEGRKKGVDLINARLKEKIKKVNAYTRQLENSKLSKKERKRLIYERNAVARTIDGSSKDTSTESGRLNGLKFGTLDNIESIIDSDWYQNKKVLTTGTATTGQNIKDANTAFNNYKIEKNKKVPDRETLQSLKTNSIDLYNTVVNSIAELNSDLRGTTDVKLKARLVKDLKSFNKLKAEFEVEFADDRVKTAEQQAAAEKNKPKEVLNSLEISSFNDGFTKKEEEILGSLSKKEKANLNNRKASAKAFKKIQPIIDAVKNTKFKSSLQTVHNQIMRGTTEQFRGIELHLEDAKKGKLNQTKLRQFITGLINKNKRLKEAKATFDKTGETVYVNKKSNEIFKNISKLPKNYKEKDYWFVNDRSTALLALLQTEVEYVQEVKTIILEVNETLKDKEKIKIIEEAEQVNNEQAEIILNKNVDDTGSLDNAEIEGEATAAETTTTEEVVKEVVEETQEESIINEVKEPETKKQRRTRERQELNALEKELTASLKVLTDRLKILNKKENQESNLETLKRGDKSNRTETNAVKSQIRIVKRRLDNEVAAKKDAREERESNHFLNKFKNTFNKLRWNPSGVTIRELFKIRDLSRESFFTMNKGKSLVTISKDGTVDASGIVSKLQSLGVTDQRYAESVAANFVKFRTIFYENLNQGLLADELKVGSYAAREYKLFLDKDGNMPDEVLFAMMLSLMHWSAINQKASENRPLYTIAGLVFNDPKQVNRLSREQIKTFVDAGIFAKDAAKDIGVEVMDLLNFSIEKPTEEDFLLRLNAIAKKTFKRPFTKRSNLQPRLATGLGLLTLQVGRYMNSTGTQGNPEEALIEVVRNEFDIKLFDNENIVVTEEQQTKETIDWNTVQIEATDELQLYKDNAENLKIIKGSESFLRDTYAVPVLDVQEETDNSFFKLSTKIKDLMLALQSVRWEGKAIELKLFSVLSTANREAIIGIKNLDEEHEERKDSVEAANKEKQNDSDHALDYYNTGENAGFYFRYKAQVQHRLRIVSNTINGQRSKIHRALFNPTGSETLVNNESHKAIFKLAVIQAFGYNITTLAEGLATFEKINKDATVIKLKKELKKPTLNEDVFNELITTLIQNKDIVSGASTHLLEGLNALSVYKAKGNFVTSIGIETDGTTNGYAISLLQFLDGNIKKPKELKDALARVGIFVGGIESKETFEKFVNSGNDDVYQSFSRKIVESIFGKTTRFKPKEQNIITVLHGKLSENGKLTKFARDLAKTPVMVSNYGGAIFKIISNVIDQIVPDLYKTLGDIQTRYNKADVEGKVKIRDELVIIQDALASVPKFGKKIDLLSYLDETGVTTDKNEIDRQNNLYGLVFSKKEVNAINSFFESVYDGEDALFKTALDDLLKPVIKARELLVKIVEAEYFMFSVAYEEAIGDLGDNIVDIDVKMRIAADLADRFMPRMTTPWSDPGVENQLIQLIRLVDTKGNRVEVTTKDFNNQKFRKSSKGYNESGKPVPEAIIGANTTSSSFDSPGVGSVVNQVQNMDSVVLADLLAQKLGVLAIFDAVISPVGEAQDNADKYNQSFLIRNLEHVFLEETLIQFKNILKNLEDANLSTEAVDTLLQTKSYRAKAIYKEIANGKDENAAELDLMNLQQLEVDLENKIQDRKNNLLGLLDTYGNADNLTLEELRALETKALNNLVVRSWRVSQMPIPESIKDKSLTPEKNTKKVNEGSETAEKINIKDVDIANTQGDPVDANTIDKDEMQAKLDAIELEEREAFEAAELAEIIKSRKGFKEADKKANEAREERESTYAEAQQRINEISDRLKAANKETEVIADDSIKSLALVRRLPDGTGAPDIYFNLNQIVNDYIKGMLYIDGEGTGLIEQTSKQKEIVFADVNKEAFKEHIRNTGGVSAYIEFIFQHELGHIVNKHTGAKDKLSEKAIKQEIEANDYAFKAIGFVNIKPKVKIKPNELTFEEKFEALSVGEQDIWSGILDEYRKITNLQKEPYANLNKEQKEILKDADLKLKSLEEALDNVIDDTDIDIKLSSIEASTEADLELVYRTNSLRGNLQAIFDKLGDISIDSYRNEADKNTQQLHLQRVFDKIISKAGGILDQTTLTLNKSRVKSDGDANITTTAVRVNYNRFRPLSYSEQTSQEVYGHEIVHILTRFAIKNDSVFKRRLEALRDQVIAEIEATQTKPYEIFLNKDTNGDVIYRTSEQAEIEAAKDQYDYVFGDKVPAEFRLDEFLAYALTNKHIVKLTENMGSQVIPLWSKDADKRVTEKLIEFFVEALNRIERLIKGTTLPLSVQQEIFDMTTDIVAVNQSKRNVLAKALQFNIVRDAINRGNKEGANLIDKGFNEGGKLIADNWIKIVDKATKDGKINNFLADILYDTKLVALMQSSYGEFVKNRPDVQAKIDNIYKNIKPSFLKNASSLWINGFGGENVKFVEMLYSSNYEVDAQRKSYKQNTKKNIQKLFLTWEDMTVTQKESITRVMLKTDLSSLLTNKAFSQAQILELIRDDAKLTAAIKKYEGARKLDIRGNNYYRLQAQQLARYMITGDTFAYEQMLNTSNIYSQSIAKNRAYKRADKQKEIDDLDIYITLLALKSPELTAAKQDVDLVMRNEFAQKESTALENAFSGMLDVHTTFKEESQNTLFLGRNGKPNRSLMTKGYIATITDDDAQLTVEKSDKESRKEMESDGYVFITNVENFTKEPHGLYVLYNQPNEPRTKGIASMKSKQFQGTDLKEIISRNPKKSGFIMQELDRIARDQKTKARKGQLSKKPTMIPVMDEDVNTSTFRFTLNHALTEQHLRQDLQVDEVMAVMQSQMIDKVASDKINTETVGLLYKYGKENYAKRPSKFVNILDTIFENEYFRPLPKDMKNDVMYHSRVNRETGKSEFFVERRLLDTVFGYQNPSIGNIGVLENSAKTKRYAKIVEKFWKEIVGIAKINIVVKTVAVPAINFLSNGVTSWMYGVPIEYLVKYWKEAALELSDYRADAEKLKDLDFRVKANRRLANNASIKSKRAILVAKMNGNKVAPFVTAGLFNSITEDINQNEFSYRNKIFTKLKETKGGKLVSGRALDIANIAYIGEKTRVFKEATHFLQISDFIARYALYKHQTEIAGVKPDAAYKTMIETFVNYDQPLNRYLAYTNDMGLIMFVKYWIRIQRAGINLVKEKPLNAALLYFGNGVLDLDIETILNSSIITGNVMPTIGGVERNLLQVLIPPGLEIITDTF